MAIWEIKRFLNKDKDLTLDDLLSAKVVCKGIADMTFEFTNKDGIYPKFVVTLDSESEDIGGMKVKLISVRPGSYSVKIGSSSYSVTVDIDDIKAGDLKSINYTLDIVLFKKITPGSEDFIVPDGINNILVSAIAGGANGGENSDRAVDPPYGGAGGGGAGEKIIKRSYSVTPGQTISITVGAVKQATKIGSLVTLQPGVVGDGTKSSSGANGGTVGGKEGANASGDNGGKGGNGGPGLDENGEEVTTGALGGAGGIYGASDNTKYGQPGKSATSYGGGGGGGGGKAGTVLSSSGNGGAGKAGMCIIYSRVAVA